MLTPQRQFLQERWVFSLFLERYCFPLLVREVCITVHHSFSCRSSSLKINHLSYSSQTWSYLNLLTFPYCSFRHWTCQEESLGLISVGQLMQKNTKSGPEICGVFAAWTYCALGFQIWLWQTSQRNTSHRGGHTVAESLSQLLSLMWEKRGCLFCCTVGC